LVDASGVPVEEEKGTQILDVDDDTENTDPPVVA
jgi:hypothetical protein